MGDDPRHGEAAAALGRGLAKREITLIYGGGQIGLMGALADAALDAGGKVIGVIPKYLHRVEVAHEGLHQLLVVTSMHERKRRMFELSDAVAVLPGGIGTLDETFEVIGWKQLGLHEKPIFLVDQFDYWRRLRALIDEIIAAGYARPEIAGLYTVTESVDALLDALATVAPSPAAHPELF